jgi:hypothetical protein
MNTTQPSMNPSFPRYLATLAAALLACTAVSADAAEITFMPDSAEVSISSQIAVDVDVQSPDDLISAYDFAVNWDAAILTLAGIDFGPSLGGPLDSIQDFTGVAGSVSVAETSLLTDLTGLQTGGDFRLFTLHFDPITPGISALSITSGAVSGYLFDTDGDPLSDVMPGSATITATPVPAPLLLVLSGLVLLANRAGRASARRIVRLSGKKGSGEKGGRS